jgi:hypothetical protein
MHVLPFLERSVEHLALGGDRAPLRALRGELSDLMPVIDAIGWWDELAEADGRAVEVTPAVEHVLRRFADETIKTIEYEQASARSNRREIDDELEELHACQSILRQLEEVPA